MNEEFKLPNIVNQSIVNESMDESVLRKPHHHLMNPKRPNLLSKSVAGITDIAKTDRYH